MLVAKHLIGTCSARFTNAKIKQNKFQVILKNKYYRVVDADTVGNYLTLEEMNSCNIAIILHYIQAHKVHVPVVVLIMRTPDRS